MDKERLAFSDKTNGAQFEDLNWDMIDRRDQNMDICPVLVAGFRSSRIFHVVY